MNNRYIPTQRQEESRADHYQAAYRKVFGNSFAVFMIGLGVGSTAGIITLYIVLVNTNLLCQ